MEGQPFVHGCLRPTADIVEFAVAAGVPRRLTHNRDGRPSGAMLASLRTRDGKFAKPGTWDFAD